MLVIGSNSELTQGEVEALEAILQKYPNLANVTVLSRYDSENVQVDRGAPWTNDFGHVCTHGEGYDLYGIHCSADGHIDAISFSIVWGQPTLADVSPVSGLVYLTNYSKPHGNDNELQNFIMSLSSLRHVSISAGQYVSSGVYEQFNLISLEAAVNFAIFPVSSYIDLTHLTIINPVGNPLPGLQTIGNQLIELKLVWPTSPVDLGILVNFTALKSFSCINCGIMLGAPRFTAGAALESATLELQTGLTDFVFQITGNSLEFLAFSLGEGDRSVQLNTSNLKSLEVSGPSEYSSFALPESLRSLSLSRLNGQAFWDNFHSLENMTSLAEIRLTENANLSNQAVQQIICSLPRDTLQIFYMKNGPSEVTVPSCLASNQTVLQDLELIANRLDRTQSFPDCLPSSLKRLAFSMQGGGVLGGWNWDSWVSHFPLMRNFIMSYIGMSVPLSPRVTEWPFLEEFGCPLNGLSGSLPYDFLLRLPRLRKLNLSYNFIEGNALWQGLDNLVWMLMEGNRVEAWPSISGEAPNLVVVTLGSNRLTAIPDEASFARMPRLGTLGLQNNPMLTGPVPKVWAQNTSFVNYVNLANCAFEGMMPELINNPYLRHIDVSNNRMCGNLPEFKDTVLFSLFAQKNAFSGGFPISWPKQLGILYELQVQENALNGTFPQPSLLSIWSFNSASLSINVSHNPLLTGPSFELMKFDGLIDFSNTDIDFCALNPNVSSTSMICILGDSYAACGCETWWPCSAGPTCQPTAMKRSHESSATEMSNQRLLASSSRAKRAAQCVEPPERPIYVVDEPDCPPPRPNGFTCVDGAWISLGSVEEPSITVPPGSTVVVQGNLTVSDPNGITFQGTISTIIVKGCVFFKGEGGVTIELTEEELNGLIRLGKLEKTLLETVNGNECDGSTDLSTVAIVAKKPAKSKGCKKVKASNGENGRDSLHVLLRIDNSTCNMIIIIPSVIGGVLILAAVATTVGLVIRNKKMNAAAA
jgi:Leucine-rich repeat (LRR) protein